MFHLEQSIAGWRKQMVAGGVETPVPLEELEIHLRDEIQRQTEFGAAPAHAFEKAVQQMGAVSSLKTEFNKNNQRKIMKRTLLLIISVIAILVGMAFVMPAVAQYRHEGAMAGSEIALLCLGGILTLGGVSAGIVSMKRRQA